MSKPKFYFTRYPVTSATDMKEITGFHTVNHSSDYNYHINYDGRNTPLDPRINFIHVMDNGFTVVWGDNPEEDMAIY